MTTAGVQLSQSGTSAPSTSSRANGLMSTQFNPYRSWLNIESDTYPPNDFQLLGLQETESDQHAIDQAADGQLERLENIESDAHHELKDLLVRQINKARSTLSDPTARNRYTRALRDAPPSDSSWIKDMVPPKKQPNAVDSDAAHTSGFTASSVNGEQELSKPISFHQSDLLPPQPGGTKPPRQSPEPKNRTANSTHATTKATRARADSHTQSSRTAKPPIADAAKDRNHSADLNPPKKNRDSDVRHQDLPIAKAVSTRPDSDQEILVARAAPDQNPTQPAPTARAVSSGDPPIHKQQPDSSEDSSRSENRPQENNRVRLILGAAGFTLVLIAGFHGIMQLLSVNDRGRDQELEERAALLVTPPDTNKPSHSSSTQLDSNETQRPPDSQLAAASTQQLTHPEGPESSKQPVETARSPTTNSSDPTTVDDTLNLETNDQPKLANPHSTEMSSGSLSLETLDFQSQRRLRIQLLDIKNLWRQQDFGAFPYSVHLDASDADQLEVLEKINQGIQETTQRLKEFWQQFKKSSLANRNDLQVGDRTVGFVEATESHVTLKVAGVLRRYEYPFVPPALMMAIIDQGAIDDIPTYRLQKAAYLISRLHSRPDFADDIEELLMLSEQDGHDVSRLRRLADLPLEILASPKLRPRYRVISEPLAGSSATAQFKSLHEVPFEVASGLARQVIEEFLDAEKRPTVDRNDPSQQQEYLSVLDRARQLAMRGGDILLAIDMVGEIQTNSQAPPNDLMLSTILRTSVAASRTVDQSKWYCMAVLEYLRQADSGLSAADAVRLGNRALQIAESHGLSAFASQLYAKIKSY